MRVECTFCGEGFEAVRRTARFCSQRCKRRSYRASGAPEPPAPDAGSAVVEDPRRLGILVATLRELEGLAKVDTVLGQSALIMARQLESGRDTGSSAAAVSRELDRLMVRIRGAEAAPRDQLADVRRRRDEKRGHARALAALEVDE